MMGYSIKKVIHTISTSTNVFGANDFNTISTPNLKLCFNLEILL